MNNKKIRKMMKKKLDWIEIHAEVFKQLCTFYCENVPAEEAFAFINKMNKISQEEILGIKSHSTEEHMEIYLELQQFYMENADPAEYAETQRLMFEYIRHLGAQVSEEIPKCAHQVN